MFSDTKPDYKACRLCSTATRLCNSHLHPKFYWQWLQRTGNGYFRVSDRPNLRLQDGYKLRMLCKDCEGRFSTRETAFAAEIFRPLVSDSSATVKYSGASYYCLISILWRCLAYDLDVDQAPTSWLSELVDAESAWRRFLLSNEPLQRYGRVHLFVTDFPTSDSPQINQYLTRDVDATAMWKESKLLGFYMKFGRFVVVAEFSGFDASNWHNTMIAETGGEFVPGRCRILDGAFGEFLLDRAAKYRRSRQEFYSRLSGSQKDVIRRNEEKQGERFNRSDLRRAQMLDAAWDGKIPKVGRNERCPCKSGIKYKHCHGAIN
jgi:hypothetical protein